MTPLVERDEIAKAWALYCERMQQGSQPFERRNGWRGGGGEYTVYWHPSQGIWATLGTDCDHGRHWCGLGTDNPMSVRNLGQVCQIAGISKMQLDYWTNKAQIPTKGKKQRIYDIDALETVMLIKQAKDKGLNLGAAIEAARRFRETNPRVAAQN